MNSPYSRPNITANTTTCLCMGILKRASPNKKLTTTLNTDSAANTIEASMAMSIDSV